MGGQLGFQHPLDHPLGQLFQQPVFPQNILGIGIIFEEFVQQGFLLGDATGHLTLLFVVIKDNQLHS